SSGCLEKADVLELTVCHLHAAAPPAAASCPISPRPGTSSSAVHGWLQEVARFLQEQPKISPRVSTSILSHLGNTTSTNVAANPNFSEAMPHLKNHHVVPFTSSAPPIVVAVTAPPWTVLCFTRPLPAPPQLCYRQWIY
ncbi:unnamed protein product, partial [Meganyctiphanes norvegica]